ncbi:blue-light photoreceptor PHR2 [Argentina anserina]|uniref:blue-light photoreceptor PHR2 n=1 Tax=Argentina anserina TaxID=57926 RepID=UPI00217649DF|nr:blue-light photoreceptor PHR2 [Potentilla anserina]
MDPNSQISENNPESSPEEQLALVPSSSSSPFATVSLSLSLASILPTHHFFHQPKLTTLFSSKAKIPTQASSLSHLSLSAAVPSTPSKLSFNSSISANPLQSPLTLNPRRPLDPSNAAGLRRASIVWFRNDLRVHDNECLNSANNESISVLPVFCFDPKDFGKSSSGFDKTGPYRAQFLVESVSDLRKNLQARGSDLVVRVGRPETVLPELAKAIGADAIYAHGEVSHDEVKAEERIEAAMKEENVEVKYFWGSTLYHMDDLPFKLEDMPTNYGGFREKVKGLEVRKTLEALEQMKGMPSRGDVEPGDVPSLMDLGLSPSASMAQDGRPSMVGGEAEALEKLKKFAAECQAQPPKGSKEGSQDNIYGANFSCKISPWLAMGCLSPRSMFDELKKTASRSVSASSNPDDGGSGTNWLMFELLWRDFFRFVTKKYSAGKKQLDAAPATACTGALA